MEHTEAEKQRVKDYYSDRLTAMLGEAGRCGVSNLEAIKHRVMIQQDWALSNHLTAEAARFADLQYWVQAEQLETTADMGILTFAIEHLESEPHQQAIAKNPNATPEILEQGIRQGTVKTLVVVASNPNITTQMLEGLLETADRIHGSVSGKPMNIWPQPTAADHKAEDAANLRKAVLSALETRRGMTSGE